ncbi:hypothetical protein [Actinacidiphila epipremni]|uniref:Uncharacterized protein n=1 Tax=Actinacidiphila epipremni TaxID=2053013 RepID=A0ABX0ZRI5_9ACTN|nr:hypothetical protein [Actinacidiphila epipremni]NJP44221.1 hypothetical protein [Actinacidiphila epipremni]
MSGGLSLVGAGEPGGELAGGVVRMRPAPGWAVGDPLAELAERLGGRVASAVHAEEVAALLESEGLTDEQITGRYRHRDLFSLAEALFALVPRAFPEPEPGPDPWRTGLLRCVLRGLTFALPGVGYVLGGRWADGPAGPFGVTAAVAGWAAAALVSWGWNQGLAHRAGLLLLAGRPRAAARCLLAGGAAGVLPATGAALALTGASHPSAPLFAFGQALYMAAATVLLVLGRERLLLYVLAPLCVAAGLGAAGLPDPAVAGALTATVGAATAVAVRTAVRSAPGGRGRAAARRDDEAPVPVRRSAAPALAGFAAGVLVVAAALDGQLVAALTVSMGVAEWLLFRFRSRCLAALRATGVAERLLARSWRVLARCLGGYAVTLVALAGVESAVLPGAPAWDVPHLSVLLALGCALWLTLLLQSCGRPWTAAAVPAAAAATALALLAAHTAAPGTVLGLTGAAATAVLLAAAGTVTARVTTHR